MFRTTKTRRYVAAWTVWRDREKLLRRLREFDDLFDQVILMCGAPAADGSLPEEWPAHERAAIAAELARMGISVLNDYSGAWTGRCAEICASPAALAACIANMAEDCERTGADGVDIDFEKWPPESRFAYTDFIAGLAAELHGRGKTLSLCAYPTNTAQRRETGVGFIDPHSLAPHVDYYRAMAYDLFCPPSEFVGPTSTAPWGRECMTYLARMVPRHKLVMGLPTYSVDWDIADPTRSRQVNDAAFIAAREKESAIGRGCC